MPWLALLSPRMWFFGAIGLLCIALGVQTIRLDHLKATLAEERADRANERLAAEENARKKEQAHAVAQQSLVEAQAAEQAEQAAALARAADDGKRLHAEIDRLTSSAGRSDANAAACKRLADRARTLGNLFSQADSLAEELARDAEQRNGQVRTLKRQLQADRSACSAP